MIANSSSIPRVKTCSFGLMVELLLRRRWSLEGMNVPQKAWSVIPSHVRGPRAFALLLDRSEARNGRVNGLRRRSVKPFQHLRLCYDTRGEFFVSIKSCGDKHCCRPGSCSGLPRLFYRTRVGNLGVLPRTHISCGMDSRPMVGINCGSIMYLLVILQ